MEMMVNKKISFVNKRSHHTSQGVGAFGPLYELVPVMHPSEELVIIITSSKFTDFYDEFPASKEEEEKKKKRTKTLK